MIRGHSDWKGGGPKLLLLYRQHAALKATKKEKAKQRGLSAKEKDAHKTQHIGSKNCQHLCPSP